MQQLCAITLDFSKYIYFFLLQILYDQAYYQQFHPLSCIQSCCLMVLNGGALYKCHQIRSVPLNLHNLF